MKTPADLTDASLKSGYRHVNYHKNGTFHAQFYGGKKTTAGHSHWGPLRKTALEAAQDACDHLNARAPITPADLVNPKRKSGYDRVLRVNANRPKQHYQAESGRRARRWLGPLRLTALEAAQDYCDYYNAQLAAPPATLKTAGHEYTIDERDSDPEYQAALGVMRDRRAQKAGKQGFVYLIVEDIPGRCYGKIGYSVNPEKRVAELQTGNPRKLKLLAKKKGTEADEKALHAKYIKNNKLQEWFTLTPSLLGEFKEASA